MFIILLHKFKVIKFQNTLNGTLLRSNLTISNYRFETSNGITREEKGTLVDPGLESEHISVEGSYSYINEEGKIETVKYVSDENGYTILTSLEVLQPVPAAVNRNYVY